MTSRALAWLLAAAIAGLGLLILVELARAKGLPATASAPASAVGHRPEKGSVGAGRAPGGLPLGARPPWSEAGALGGRKVRQGFSATPGPVTRTVGYGQIRFNGLGPERWARRYRREHQRVLRLLRRLRGRTLQSSSWRARQIRVADQIGRASAGDPWPNCPDPYDGSGATWDETVSCENGGDWMDTPGFYRCGLQFDPMWERKYGRLCP